MARVKGRGEREEGAMFRLLPGISDIVPLRKNPKTGGYERAARGAVLRRRARALRLLGRLSFAKCFMALRSSQLAFVWYPGPSALSQAMTSESRRMVTGRFAGRWNFPISAALQSRTGGASEKSMSLSLFAAIARTSRFCAFVSFLIGFPFMGRGGTSRNDTNDFFLAFFINRMNDQQDRARSDRSDGYQRSSSVKASSRWVRA